MRDFDNNLLTILQAPESALGFFVDLTVSDSLVQHFTSFDIPLVWNSNRYTPQDMKLDTFNYSADLSVDKFRLKLNNVSLVQSAIFLNNDLRRKSVTINVGGFVLGDEIYAAPVFVGLISDWELEDTFIDIGISSELITWNMKNLRKPDVLCQWGFGSVECTHTVGYQETCNKTYEKCLSYNNTDNYGGFRFIGSIEEKEIIWGPRK